jgi:hypothetical protein
MSQKNVILLIATTFLSIFLIFANTQTNDEKEKTVVNEEIKEKENKNDKENKKDKENKEEDIDEETTAGSATSTLELGFGKTERKETEEQKKRHKKEQKERKKREKEKY